jgi:valyl-tRNA synthetase
MISKRYDFKSVESRLYKFWEENGYFKPTNDPNLPGHDPTKKPYVISIPPPNVTGVLHLGHVLFVTLEDLMIRHQRMKGVPTLWVPGTDHAGIATQHQVEMKLKEEGTSREEIGRNRFLEETWEWKEVHGGRIVEQIRRLGASCDWSRERFTLDNGLSRAVREAFVRLYEKGLIYRGPRLINWSPTLQTAVSDLEVEHAEEQGKLYYFKYRLADQPDEFIPVATTRPETILADTAVAVHPDDDRYNKFIGKKALVPILDREIPIIADEYVSMDFGTGALKITPGHDPNDYEIGQRHDLEVLSMLDKSACVTEVGGPYKGLDRFEAREKLWADMKDAGLVIKEEDYLHQIPRAQRGGEIIEPMISTQWFVHIAPLAEKALQVVRDGQIEIVPERFKKIYYNWLENIHDWCISRQLWWGHRIPVWYCDDCQELTVSREDPSACQACGSENIRQDPDVLDTWFSSGLWPFSTLGWPDETPDLDYFFPTTMMETGYDILFFWVARMIMFSLEMTGKIPFEIVYLHGLVMDEHGQKMSKSKGNAIDPLDVMNDMGTDAVRFTMLVGSTPGLNTNLSLPKVEANRNFANKIWNAGRFILGTLENVPGAPEADPSWTLPDSWIWARTQQLIRDTNRLFDNHQYGEAGKYIYEFFWGDFADWYLEIAKNQIKKGGDRAFYTVETLIKVLDLCLRLLHPFTPFVTEELWQHLREAVLGSPYRDRLPEWPQALMITSWPESRELEDWEEPRIKDFELIQEIVRTIRNWRAEKNIKPGKLIPVELVGGEYTESLSSELGSITALASLDPEKTTILFSSDMVTASDTGLVAGPVEIYPQLKGLINIEEEKERITSELDELRGEIQRLETLLASPFAQKAPPQIVEKEREKLSAYQETSSKLEDHLNNLEEVD